jgi:hypothetical protein
MSWVAVEAVFEVRLMRAVPSLISSRSLLRRRLVAPKVTISIHTYPYDIRVTVVARLQHQLRNEYQMVSYKALVS